MRAWTGSLTHQEVCAWSAPTCPGAWVPVAGKGVILDELCDDGVAPPPRPEGPDQAAQPWVMAPRAPRPRPTARTWWPRWASAGPCWRADRETPGSMGCAGGAPRCTLVARSGKEAVIPGVLPSSVRRTSCAWCSTPGAAQRCDRAAAALLTAGQTRAPPPAATGRFVARLFVREDTWLVGVACDTSGCRAVAPDRRRCGRAGGGSGGTGRHGVGQVWAGSAWKAVGV